MVNTMNNFASDGEIINEQLFETSYLALINFNSDLISQYEYLNTLSNQNILNLYSQLSNLPTANLFETYRKNLYESQLFIILNGFLSEAHVVNLLEITEKCRFDYNFMPVSANLLLPICLQKPDLSNNICEAAIPPQPIFVKVNYSDINNSFDPAIFLLSIDGRVIGRYLDKRSLINDKSLLPGLYIIKSINHAQKYFHQ